MFTLSYGDEKFLVANEFGLLDWTWHHIVHTMLTKGDQNRPRPSPKALGCVGPLESPHFFHFLYFLCHNPNLGVTTKAWACKAYGPNMKPKSHISCSQKCKRVWENEPPHSQVSSHFRNWSPNGLPNLQKAIVGVKIHWIENFLISLESSWNINV